MNFPEKANSERQGKEVGGCKWAQGARETFYDQTVTMVAWFGKLTLKKSLTGTLKTGEFYGM